MKVMIVLALVVLLIGGVCGVEIGMLLDVHSESVYNITINSYTLVGAGIAQHGKGWWATYPSLFDPIGGASKLTVRSVKVTNGSDGIGSFRRTELAFTEPIPFIQAFREYEGGIAVVFEQSFPQGAENTQIMRLNGSENYWEAPQSWAPAFRADLGALTELSVTAWLNNDIAGRLEGGGDESWATDAGPTVLMDEFDATVAVFSPLNSFLAASENLTTTWSRTGEVVWAHGCGGELDVIPAGYSQEFILYGGGSEVKGLGDVVLGWGEAIRSYHNASTPKMSNLTTTTLGVMSDHGAAVYVYDWLGNMTKGEAQEWFVEIWDSLHSGTQPHSGAWFDTASTNISIPAHWMQLDAGWYPTLEGHNGCVENFTANTFLFPDGVPSFFERIGLDGRRAWLYQAYYCPDNAYLSEGFHFNWTGTRSYGEVMPEEAATFYHRVIVEQGVPQQIISFESDYLFFTKILLDSWRRSTSAWPMWLHGMAEAAQEAGIPIQSCLSHPSFLLHMGTIERTFSNGRATMDFANDLQNLLPMGFISWLFRALDLKPSGDVFWTGPATQPMDREHSYHPNPHLHTISKTWSTGPVGIGDQAGYTAADLVFLSCSASGTILSPSAPAISLPSTWAVDPTRRCNASAAWISNSILPSPNTMAWDIVIANLTTPFHLHPNDLVPSPPHSHPLLTVRHWNRVSQRTASSSFITATLASNLSPSQRLQNLHAFQSQGPCAHLSPAYSTCATLWNTSNLTTSPLLKTLPPFANQTLDFAGVSISTPLPYDWVLLGELAKAVPLSPSRLKAVIPTPATLQIQVQGEAGELVDFAVIHPNQTVLRLAIQVGSGGVGRGGVDA